MKEGKILHTTIPPETESAARLYKPFLTKDFLTRQDIYAMATLLAASIKPQLQRLRTPQEQATVVLDVLRPEQILIENRVFLERLGYNISLIIDGDDQRLIGARLSYTDDQQQFHSEVVSVAELQLILLRIREALWIELAPLLDNAIVHLIERDLKPSGRVQQLFGDRVLKRPWCSVRNDSLETDEDYAFHWQALKDLYALPERSPYLSYQHAVVDPAHNVIELQYTFHFQTLQDILNESSEQFSFYDIVSYFLDAMRGASFLVDHDFILTDLALCNIAVVPIDRGRHRGTLFDYDFLRHKNNVSSSNYYAAHEEYDPPADEFPLLTEANMVYEFGIGLKSIFNDRVDDSNEFPQLQSLIHAMTAHSSPDRPSPHEAIARLQALLPSLKNF